MLKKSNPTAALNKEVLICYFRDSLRLSIWAQSDKRDRDLDTWEEAIKKAINEKAKTAYQPQFLMKKIYNRYFCGHQLSKTDEPGKEQKDSDSHKSKPQEQKPPAC